jgi:hypothetical protein
MPWKTCLSTAICYQANGQRAIQALLGLLSFRGKRLTNTPVRQAGSVLKLSYDRKNRVVSTEETYPRRIQQLVAKFVSCGLLRSEFCQSRGLSFSTLDRHLSKLRWKRRHKPISSAGVEPARRALISGSYIQADETPVDVRKREGRGKNHQAYLWQYSRPGGSTITILQSSLDRRLFRCSIL